MTRIRRLSPWYWVILGATFLGLGVFVTNLLYDWAPKWLTLVASLIPLVAAIYVGRMLWKQSDHPAFHGKGTVSGDTQKFVGESDQGRE